MKSSLDHLPGIKQKRLARLCGFCGKNFLAGTADELVSEYPDQEQMIRRLSVNGHETKMPEDFEDD